MNIGILISLPIKPFIKPQKAPIRRIRTIITPNGSPILTSMIPTKIPSMPVIRPTERSMLPDERTQVKPKASTK